ncbi:MAG: hypothetical protein J7J98_09445 [candidate division Zixibacteria bacterium]|nr:hypothetical protein [candidate division Zixibacteria bacterium]
MTRILIIAIFVITLIGATGATFAQGGPTDAQLGQLRNELDRTDELIIQAREAVRISNSAIAAQALSRAEMLQEQARQAYQNQAYLLSLSLTRKSREQAGLALSNSRLSEQLEGVVHSRLEKAREMLDRAREALPTPPGPIASTLLEQARNYLAQAGEFYHQRRYRAAVKVIEQVEQITQRLGSMARMARQAGETFQHRIENIERLIEYARDLLTDCGSERGLELLRYAENAMLQARQFEANNQPRAALMSLEQARKSARRAARECQDGDLLQRRYQRLQNEYDQITEHLTEYDGERRETIQRLLSQAREQLELTRKQLTENKVESAQLSLQAAQLALRQVQRYLGGKL